MDRMETIERQVRHYADARQTLSGAVARLQVDMGKVKDRHLPRVREAAKALAGAQSTLETLVEQNPELFDRPKTREAHGVRFGFRKQKGKITVASEKNTIALIRRKLPGLVKTLIKVTEKPVKAALGKLSAADLKKIGVTIGNATDTVVVEPADGEIDKIVAALLESEEAGQ